MSSTIAPLEPHVISHLRSSLVISSIEQCVRELIYNSLDADATSIHIIIDISKFYVRIVDNGKGLSETELKQVAVRHATSKCHSVRELETLQTLGYRGEALASLADISILEIVSRKKDTSGAMGIWKNRELLQLSSAHCQPGTMVTVRDLFYKFPVRRKSIHQEKCIDMVRKTVLSIALAFSHVSFSLLDGALGNKLLVTKRTSSTMDVLGQLFGYSFREFIRPFEYNDDVYGIRLLGYFGIRAHPTKNYQYIYLNRRHIPSNRLYKIAAELFASSKVLNKSSDDTDISPKVHGLLDRHPIFFIYIDHPSLSSYNVDQFLILLQEHQLFSYLEDLVRYLVANFLRTYNQISSAQYASFIHNDEPPKKRPRTMSASPSDTTEKYLDSAYNLDSISSIATDQNPPADSLHCTEQQAHEYIPESQDTNRIDRTRLRRSRPTTASSWKEKIDLASQGSDGTEMTQRLNKSDLINCQVLCQVDRKFILIKLLQSGLLLLVDQHAADERIKLERMQGSLSETVESMQLDPSIHIDLSEQEQRAAERYVLYLKRWGVHFGTPRRVQHGSSKSSGPSILLQSTHFRTGEKSPFFEKEGVWVTRLPRLIADRCVVDNELLRDFIREYIHWLEEAGPSASPDICPNGIMQILKSKACRGAIMFNDELRPDQCEWLIRSLAQCDFPFQCAHGRPSMVPIIKIDHQSSQRERLRWTGSLREKLFQSDIN